MDLIVQNFDFLFQEYQSLDVKLNRFEELIQAREREKYLVENIEIIVTEEKLGMKGVKKYLKKFKNFRFFKSDLKELFLVNMIVQEIKAMYIAFSSKKKGLSKKKINSLFCKKHRNSAKYFKGFVKEIRSLRDIIRADISVKKKAGIKLDI